MQCKKLHSSENSDCAEYNMNLHVCIIDAKQPWLKFWSKCSIILKSCMQWFFCWIGCLAKQDILYGVHSHTSDTNLQSSITATRQTYLSHTNQPFSSSGNTHNCSDFENWRTSGCFVAFSLPPQQWNEIDFSRQSKYSSLPSATFWNRQRNVCVDTKE